MDKKEKNDNPQTDEKDSRVPCKYGVNCYQKNPDHHKKYKHPQRNKTNNDNDISNNKKRKSPDEPESSTTDESKTKKQNVSTDLQNPTNNTSKEDGNSKANDSNDENNSEKKESSKNEEISQKDKFEEKLTEKEDTVMETTCKADDNVEETKMVDEIMETTETVPEIKVQETKVPVEEQKTTEESKKETVKEKVKVEKEKDEDAYAEAKALILKFFLVSMPNDFYKFYEFCNDLKPSDPATAFKIADLRLVGPYDVLCGLVTHKLTEDDSMLIHWRYYYDPPEFQTILKGSDKEGLHFGYWRDRPSSNPVFVATNCSNVSHKIKPVAENIFGAVANYLEEKAKKANPFEKTGFFNLLGKLKLYAKTHNITLEAQTAKMKQREKNVVARTIHGAGIVCPYNKKTQLGYRELSVTDNQLLKIVKKIDDHQSEQDRENARAELNEVVRLATIAGDECDFGTCLELGHDLLSTGCVHVQNAALVVLNIAYNQLERQAFLKIVEAHMKNRKKGTNVGVLGITTKELARNS